MHAARIVQTVTGRTLAELRVARDASRADMVELRADGVADLDVGGALEGRRCPVIFTCRAPWEGGAFDGAETERLAILGRAISLGADFVDVEWKADRRALPPATPGQLVLSHHDFSGTPSDLEARVAAMRKERPAVLKISVTAARLDDCLRLRRATDLDLPHVAIAMGAPGQVSRLCPRLFGSLWTYGGTAAPGQTAVSDLRELFRVGRQGAGTRLFGVAGAAVAADHPSVVLHNVAAAQAGIDAVCVPLPTTDARELLAVADVLDVQGIAVAESMGPALIPLLDDVEPAAQRDGALDTLRRRGCQWQGRHLGGSAADAIGHVRLQVQWWTGRRVARSVLTAAARDRGWPGS